MTDREMLELAAKAAGLVPLEDVSPFMVHVSGWGYRVWNPLADDGDALRLVVALQLSIDHNHAADQQRWVAAERSGREGCFSPVSKVEDNFEESGRAAATRLAITRAAAEIGKQMGGGDV